MSDFLKFCQAVAVVAKKDAQASKGEAGRPANRKTIPCKYCLAEVELFRQDGLVHCRNCGSSFPVQWGKPYTLDPTCREKFSGKQAYDAAFCGGAVNFSLLELAAEKNYLKALLYLGRHHEARDAHDKAQTYYTKASEIGMEGKAAHILYTFRRGPSFDRYPQLLDELKYCVSHPFYTVDPNACDEEIEYREKLYRSYQEQERTKAEPVEEMPYTPMFSDDPYGNPAANHDDSTDWNGLPWVISGIGNGV